MKWLILQWLIYTFTLFEQLSFFKYTYVTIKYFILYTLYYILILQHYHAVITYSCIYYYKPQTLNRATCMKCMSGLAHIKLDKNLKK